VSALIRTLTTIGAVGAATAAGALFTFSTFTIEGLRRLPPSQGASAMQSINKQAPTPLFMLVLFGTAAVCVAVGINASLNLDDAAARYQLAAAALYIVGVVIVTIGYHVPRNDTLAALDPNSAEGIRYWATYLNEWVPMNHVRTIVPLISAALFTVSLQVD
jgi:uncharacterized membrane protein